MRLLPRVLGIATLVFAISAERAVAQRSDDSFRWYLSGQAGVLGFETPAQTRTWVPSVGAGLLVVAKRTGLMVSVDEAIGSNETTAFGDASGVRTTSFDRIRKYSAVLTGYPIRGKTQPYFGLGFGILQTINPEPVGAFQSAAAAALAKDQADERSADGFMSFTAGLQFRVGRLAAFGHYQITTSPSTGHLLRGSTHAVIGGLRFGLGSAREGIRGGGY